MQSKKDWEDEFEEMESIYKFPYPENIADAKCNPSESLSIILTTPITMHKNIAKSRKTYSKSAINQIIGFDGNQKLLIDTQSKNKLVSGSKSPNCKKPKNIQKLPMKIDPVDQGDKKIDLPTRKLSDAKCEKSKSGKVCVKSQSKTTNTVYHRTRKNLKRKLDEEKNMSANDSTDTLQKVPKPDSKVQNDENTISSKVIEDVNVEENSKEGSSYDLDIDFQPPPPAQKLSLMDLVQKYSESINPSQPEEVERKAKKPTNKTKLEKACAISRTSSTEKNILLSPLGDRISNNSVESNEKVSESDNSSIFSQPCPEKSQANVENKGIPYTISNSNEKVISSMNMCESLIKSCKGKVSDAEDSTVLSNEGKNFNINLNNSRCDNPSKGKNFRVKRTTVSVKKVITQEKTCKTDLEPDFQIQHRTSYLQSADFFCAFMGEVQREKKELVSKNIDETSVANDITVRQFCSSPNVNDAFSEILNGCADISDSRPPKLCYEFPDDFFNKPFQSVLKTYVDWILDVMISHKNINNDSYFSSKYILEFSYKFMSYQECAIMSMVFNDPKEHLKLSSVVAKLSFVGMVIIFNAYLKKTCLPH